MVWSFDRRQFQTHLTRKKLKKMKIVHTMYIITNHKQWTKSGKN